MRFVFGSSSLSSMDDQSKCTIFDGEGDGDGVVASARLHTTGKFLNDENYVYGRGR